MHNILQWRPTLVMDYAWRLQNVSQVDSTSRKSCLCSPVVSWMRGLHRCKRCSFSQPEDRKEVICSEDHPVEGVGSWGAGSIWGWPLKRPSWKWNCSWGVTMPGGDCWKCSMVLCVRLKLCFSRWDEEPPHLPLVFLLLNPCLHLKEHSGPCNWRHDGFSNTRFPLRGRVYRPVDFRQLCIPVCTSAHSDHTLLSTATFM